MSATFSSYDPTAQAPIAEFAESTAAEVSAAASRAGAAFPVFSGMPAARRCDFLEAVASGLEANAEVVPMAMRETGLPEARLTGERARTCFQLRSYAAAAREGSLFECRWDAADPARSPLPKPDLRSMLVGIGPVAVFGSSNFPLAYSVAGGDTASALAAGCPVVVKAHPAHPGTSEIAAGVIRAAAAQTGMPDGVFEMVHGGTAPGVRLVQEPVIAGVGFTGSLRGGRALFDLAAARPRPIPVFAEMGSVNPVFVLPGAISERASVLADGYAASLTLGVGQFCTNPGVLVGLAGAEFDALLDAAAERLRATSEGVMLTRDICAAYGRGAEALGAKAGVETLVQPGADGTRGRPGLFACSAADFLADRSLQEEVFGPAGIAVRCSSPEEMLRVAREMDGQLTASVHFADSDLDMARQLFAVLPSLAGRVVANGFPTGVEVSHAMVHGGPYPASSDARFTSVGAPAIRRWLRPVCWQNVPEALLPQELRIPR